jgi:hypothetical protein
LHDKGDRATRAFLLLENAAGFVINNFRPYSVSKKLSKNEKTSLILRLVKTPTAAIVY